MKFYKKYFNFHHWLAVLRRQPAHMQHFYALVFSGVITAMLGAGILYFDYGFWHERYSRTEALAPATQEKSSKVVETVPPSTMINGFFKEASVRLQAIKESKDELLEGKEVYIKEDTSIKNNASSTWPQNKVNNAGKDSSKDMVIP